MAQCNAGAHVRRDSVPSKAAIIVSMLIIVGVLVAAAIIAIFTV